LPLFKVVVAKHAVAPRWVIPDRRFTIPAYDCAGACRTAVRWSHADAKVPPWRPCVERTLMFTNAVPAQRPPEHATPERFEQLRIAA
jgi:hypothetical protein